MAHSKNSYIQIGSRKIGIGFPVYIIAELSANHRHDFNEAEKLIRAAKDAGADAVKLQTYTADTLTIDCQAECFQQPQGSLWQGRTLYDLYQEGSMPWAWQPKLKELADNLDIDLFSTPFDPTAVDFLEQMNVPAYKIASFEIVDIPLLEKVAACGKPLIISTGMASEKEIGQAGNVARQAGAEQIALLKCCSAYPAPPAEMNLRTIPDMIDKFEVPVGLSDHTLGIEVPIAAVVFGACIIEKHFTLDRSESSLDAAFSMEPEEFAKMVASIRTVEQALGKVYYGSTQGEVESVTFRRSLFIVADVKAGESLTESNLRSIRPGQGLPAKHLRQMLGKKARRDLSYGTPLGWNDVE